MRRKVLLFFVINIVIVAFLVRSVWPLLALLVLDGAEDAITRAELPAPNSRLIDDIPKVIPRILHQTYISTGIPDPETGAYVDHPIPDVWREAQQSCIDAHPEYEYKLWNDSNSRDFIEAEYPWFIDTWDGYPFSIERADAIRYFALVHYGGIYVDLDDGCQRSLDPLRTYPAWVRKTKPTGIGNDVLGAVPQHPFFLKLIDRLPRYNRNWFSPYITIMSSTGPLYASLIWRHYNTEEHSEEDRVRVLFPDEYMGHSWSFFSHHIGNSWHKWDADTIFWMGKHWMELTFLGFAVAGVVFTIMWWAYGKMALVPSSSRAVPFYQRLPFVRRLSSNKEASHELLNLHEV